MSDSTPPPTPPSTPPDAPQVAPPVDPEDHPHLEPYHFEPMQPPAPGSGSDPIPPPSPVPGPTTSTDATAPLDPEDHAHRDRYHFDPMQPPVAGAAGVVTSMPAGAPVVPGPPPGAPAPVPPPAPAPSASTYFCPYCRLMSAIDGLSCPNCGAPVDITEAISQSGWVELPRIADMARIQFGRSHAQISGTYVPVIEMDMADDASVYFSHHVLLWVDTEVQLDTMPMSGAWNRTLAGMPLVMMTARGPGTIAFSDDNPGESIAVPLHPGQAVDVREHRFLTATHNVGYTYFSPGLWYWSASGNERSKHFPVGRFMDRFQATPESGPGLLFLHAAGNVFLRDLAQGETILVHPSALLYKDPYVGMQLHFEYPGGYTPNTFGINYGPSIQPWLRMWGPGRVAVQSVFDHDTGTIYRITSGSPATEWRW